MQALNLRHSLASLIFPACIRLPTVQERIWAGNEPDSRFSWCMLVDFRVWCMPPRILWCEVGVLKLQNCLKAARSLYSQAFVSCVVYFHGLQCCFFGLSLARCLPIRFHNYHAIFPSHNPVWLSQAEDQSPVPSQLNLATPLLLNGDTSAASPDYLVQIDDTSPLAL